MEGNLPNVESLLQCRLRVLHLCGSRELLIPKPHPLCWCVQSLTPPESSPAFCCLCRNRGVVLLVPHRTLHDVVGMASDKNQVVRRRLCHSRALL